MHKSSRVLTLLFTISLTAACLAAPFAPDPQIAALARQVHSESQLVFARLKTAGQPDCGYAHNQQAYGHLSQLSESLRRTLADKQASAAMLRAADALIKAIVHAAASHQLASADPSDSNGLCMAPVAIDLNARAIARAASAIAATQTPN
jgi:hypothetical protein